MASGFAKHAGRLGVCIGATGHGAIDGAPVVALIGLCTKARSRATGTCIATIRGIGEPHRGLSHSVMSNACFPDHIGNILSWRGDP